MKGMTGGAIGLAMGIFSVCSLALLLRRELIATSTAVPGLSSSASMARPRWPSSPWRFTCRPTPGWRVNIGGILQRLNIRMQQAEASYRGELTVLLRNSFHVAASGGERAQRKMHGRTLLRHRQHLGQAQHHQFDLRPYEKIYNFVAQRSVAYAPGVLSYMNGSIGLKSYITGAELINQLISQCSWFIHVMPEIATLRANARRVTDLANAIEAVQKPTEFYKQTGRNDFRFSTQKAVSA